MKKKLVSAIKPTGTEHFGNYFGVIQKLVKLQDEYDSNIFIADLHAITTVQNKQELSENSLNIAVDFLSLGLDPKKVTIFKQSDLTAVTEMAWIFGCITTMPYLMRAHAFKDAEAKNKEINVGVFNYPLLMAADILIHNADVVPVGKDQKQHIEITRDIAEKFNKIYGETFKVPEPLINKDAESIPGIDGRKMSKSYKNTIEIFADRDQIKERIMSIKTDSVPQDAPKSTDSILFKIHKMFLAENETNDLIKKYQEGISYKQAKEDLIDVIDNFSKPLREKRNYWINKKDMVLEILNDGAKKTKKETQKTVNLFRDKIGFNL
ncbi:MAG TPA: tryptophan--tRNA ligase [Candidatus Paceibacterota bacterium]|nr:tryptophan--tRNA ligase [Candidatus Paceibacterota bacterium]HMP18743.1 tryptophan--tRNA ligase [Candidatus Paceibacterota bacterium]HMP85250.1 tryptophan--tRNA ligase [Candidatus Paceibacterota bacterium]